jgi:hypothetical protein
MSRGLASGPIRSAVAGRCFTLRFLPPPPGPATDPVFSGVGVSLAIARARLRSQRLATDIARACAREGNASALSALSTASPRARARARAIFGTHLARLRRPSSLARAACGVRTIRSVRKRPVLGTTRTRLLRGLGLPFPITGRLRMGSRSAWAAARGSGSFPYLCGSRRAAARALQPRLTRLTRAAVFEANRTYAPHTPPKTPEFDTWALASRTCRQWFLSTPAAIATTCGRRTVVTLGRVSRGCRVGSPLMPAWRAQCGAAQNVGIRCCRRTR